MDRTRVLSTKICMGSPQNRLSEHVELLLHSFSEGKEILRGLELLNILTDLSSVFLNYPSLVDLA